MAKAQNVKASPVKVVEEGEKQKALKNVIYFFF